jgi:bacterioferritin-associated ferredoxin
MIVCSCNVVSDHQIRCLAKGGMKKWKSLVRRTRVGTGCGTCAKRAKQIFEEAVEEAATENVAQASNPTSPQGKASACAGICGTNNCAASTPSEEGA